MNGYANHYHKARQEFQEWFYKHHPNEEMKVLYDMMPEDMREFDDEFNFAMNSFDDCEQVKILYDHKVGHCLKVKWEHSPWWEKQVLHFYYCVMLPIDNIDFKFPHELVKEEE